jgi:hypothetical protein
MTEVFTVEGASAAGYTSVKGVSAERSTEDLKRDGERERHWR